MKRKFMYFWAIILIAVMTLTCGFFFACSGGGEDEEEVEEVEEEFDPYAIIGVWSNPAIVAETDIYGITEATAGVELTIEQEEREDGSIGGVLSLAIKGILVEIPNNPFDLDFSSYETEMTGTWEATEDDYVMKLDDNEDVTNNEPLKLRPVRDGDGEVYALTLSFSITYSVFGGFLNIPISMNGAMLYAGHLPYGITTEMVVAVPSSANVTYNGASFANANGFTITGEKDDDGNVIFTASGTAATMSEEQAVAFGGNARAGDAYVIIGIYSNVGDVITWTTSLGEEKSWEKTEEIAADDDDLAIIERISETTGSFTFTITSADGNSATVSVSLKGVVISSAGGEDE